MTTDVDAQAAKDQLEQAIRAYYAVVEPDTYVNAWLIVTHKLSPQWEQKGSSVVGLLAATGQHHPMTLGMLDVAIDAQKGGSR